MSIRRVTVTTDRAFDDVVAAVFAGLVRVPDFGELVQRLMAANSIGESRRWSPRSKAAAV